MITVEKGARVDLQNTPTISPLFSIDCFKLLYLPKDSWLWIINRNFKII